MRTIYFIFFLLFFISPSHSKAGNTIYILDSTGTKIDSCTYSELELNATLLNDHRPNPIIRFLKKRELKNKRIIAAILAFPFPFGIVGLHRIYLGTAPYVPVAYIGSFGGIFGILPFIDFCVIILDKDFDRYINNNKIFMWIN